MHALALTSAHPTPCRRRDSSYKTICLAVTKLSSPRPAGAMRLPPLPRIINLPLSPYSASVLIHSLLSLACCVVAVRPSALSVIPFSLRLTGLLAPFLDVAASLHIRGVSRDSRLHPFVVYQFASYFLGLLSRSAIAYTKPNCCQAAPRRHSRWHPLVH